MLINRQALRLSDGIGQKTATRKIVEALLGWSMTPSPATHNRPSRPRGRAALTRCKSRVFQLGQKSRLLLSSLFFA